MKTTKQNKLSLKLLGKIFAIVLILLLSLISFAGIYKMDKNAMKNLIPKYKLGMDLYGARNIKIKVDDSTETKKYDSEGNLITEDSETTDENVTEKEEPINAPESLTLDNYQATRDTIIKRLEYMKVSDYLIRFDEATGEINLEIPEDSNADYISQYVITKGEFKISDDDTQEVLLGNNDIKKAEVQYNTTSTGTTVYLKIEFNKEGKEKLKEISNTYVSKKDDEGKDVTKKIKMTLDDQTIMTTSFGEEISDGIIEISIGNSSNSSELQSYLRQASNIAVFLNTNPMPITYKIELNRFVYSDITSNTIKTIVIIFAIIAILMIAYAIIRFRLNGLMGAIVDIGFAAILLLAIRYCNVTLTLTGLFTIAIACVLAYIITMLILQQYKNNKDKEIVKKNIKKLLKNVLIVSIPLMAMAITFSLTNYEAISSIGMVLFWSILTIFVYGLIILPVGLFETNKDTKKSKEKTNKKNSLKNKSNDSKQKDNKTKKEENKK